MNMSSGLHFTAPRDPDYSEDKGYPDHMFIYTGAVDAFEYSYEKPLQFPPGTEGRYRNSDPLTLGYLVKKTVTGTGHGEKRQIQAMVGFLLPKATFESADEADALAIAICHANHRATEQAMSLRVARQYGR